MAAGFSKNEQEYFVNNHKNELIGITSSKLAVYKNPKSLYHHVINLLAVSKKCQRSGDSLVCPLESKYKELKSQNFPLKELEFILETAKLNVKSDAKSQTSIKKFFVVKPKEDHSQPVVQILDPFETEVPVEVEILSEFENNITEGEVSQNEMVCSEVGGKDFQELFSNLGLKSHKAWLEENHNLNVVSKNLNPKLLDYVLYSKEVDNYATWFQSESQFSMKKNLVETKLTELRNLLEDFRIYLQTDFVPQPDTQKCLGEFAMFCKLKMQDLQAPILSIMMELAGILPDMIRRLKKRISFYTASKEDPSIKFDCKNPSLSWEKCLRSLSGKTSGLSKVSPEEFERIAHLFNYFASQNIEFCTPQELLSYLGKDKLELKSFNKILLESLPLILITNQEVSIFIDGERFFSSAHSIFNLVQMVSNKDSTNENNNNRTEHPAQEQKCDRKRGRPLYSDQRPDVLEAVKEFVVNSGITAHLRRRNDQGGFGFSIPQLHQFVSDKFYKEDPDMAPSLTTLRRFFAAANSNNNASKHYHQLINARPATKRNNEHVGDIHAHRHQCFATVKAVRELAAKHDDDCEVFSVDDKCKIPMGTPAVSRLVHQRRFFMKDQAPKLADHDLRTGFMIVPNGYMRLQTKTNFIDTRATVSPKGMAESMEANEMIDTLLEDEADYKVEEKAQQFLDSNILEDLHLIPNSETPAVPSKDLSFEEFYPPEEEYIPVDDLFVTGKVLCFCETTQWSCKICKKPCCDFCASGDSAEELSKRFCKLCAAPGCSWQVDGQFDSDSDSGSDLEPRKHKKRCLAAVDTSSDDELKESEVQIIDDLEEDLGSFNEQSANNIEAVEAKFKIIEDEEGREHVSYPHTGEFYIFFKSNTYKPSTIERHLNDMTNIRENNTTSGNKPVLVIIADDGADWGLRSPVTAHALGKFFRDSNLDFLAFVKIAPGDSRFNPVEHGWGFLTPKLSGVVLPAKIVRDDADEDVPKDVEGSSPVDVDEEEKVEVFDKGINVLVNLLSGLKFDGHLVKPVAVNCLSDEVSIDENLFNNAKYDNFEELHDFYDSKSAKETLRKMTLNKVLLKEVKFINKHMDKREHGIFFRKCSVMLGDKPCKYCRLNPPRASKEFWKDLPSRSLGGLFWDLEPDTDHPGHFKTFLSLVAQKSQVVPDGQLQSVQRCQVKKKKG